MNKKIVTLTALVLSAWPTVTNLEVSRKEPVKSAYASEGAVQKPYSLNLDFIEFRNHRELTRDVELNSEKIRQLEEDVSAYLLGNNIDTPEQAISYSLDFVGRSLDFRWDYIFGKEGSGYFNFPTGVKTTDCVDYAFLFDKVLEYVSAKVGLTGISSQVMRSDGYIFGRRLDFHDWVKINEAGTDKTWNIDPIFHDYGINPILDGKVK